MGLINGYTMYDASISKSVVIKWNQYSDSNFISTLNAKEYVISVPIKDSYSIILGHCLFYNIPGVSV